MDDEFDDLDQDLDNVFMMERQLYTIPMNTLEEIGTRADGGGGQHRDPMKRLIQFCRTIIDEMTNVNILFLSRDKIAFMLERIHERVAHPEYLNPTALVLGFWLVDNPNVRMDEDRFKKIVVKLNLLQFPVRPHDVIRYARLWQQHLY